jgi:hypothetical protein
MAIEIVDFPIKHGDFPSFFVRLPGWVYVGSPRATPKSSTEVLPRKLAAEVESQRLLGSWEHLDIGENSSTSLSPTLKSVMFRGSKKKS